MRKDLSVIFYTANFIDESFASNVRKQLVKSINGLPLIVVSHKPMGIEMFKGHSGEYKNIVFHAKERNFANIYRQALLGAIEAKTTYVATAEDDALYPPEHFEHVPTAGKFAYDRNIWGIYTWTDPPVFSWKGRRSFWTCVCERELLIEALEERFAKHPYPEKSKFITKLFGEPGKYEDQMGVTVRDWEFYYADQPSVVFSHESSLSFLNLGKRKKLGDGQKEDLPFWGNCRDILKLYKKKDNQINKKIMNEEKKDVITMPLPAEPATVKGKKEGGILSNIVKGMSPTPPKIVEMDFPDALREVIAGKKITKLEWTNKAVYGYLKDERLTLRKDDGKPYHWILSDADIRGTDFVVVD